MYTQSINELNAASMYVWTKFESVFLNYVNLCKRRATRITAFPKNYYPENSRFPNFETQLQIPTTTGDPPFRRRRRRRLLRLRQCGAAVEAMGVKNLWDILDSCKQKLPLNHLQ
jgi:hypothetical protein